MNEDDSWINQFHQKSLDEKSLKEKEKMNEKLKFHDYIHEEAKKFRSKKRKELINDEIPKEDSWLIKKLEEMFPDD